MRKQILSCLNDMNGHNNIDLNHAYEEIARFFRTYEALPDAGYPLKIRHTYFVADNAKALCVRLNLSKEDTDLAVLIALLHDIGRFEEMKRTGMFNGAKFDHAALGVKMLFEEGMIRTFIDSDQYDCIIHDAILFHSLYELPPKLRDRTLLHARILRDADKLDNFRVKIEEPVENLFPGHRTDLKIMENSLISEPVYSALRNRKSVNIKDRKTPLDYYMTVIGFYFGLYFEESRQIVKQNQLIRQMAERFDYRDPLTASQVEEIIRLTEM